MVFHLRVPRASMIALAAAITIVVYPVRGALAEEPSSPAVPTESPDEEPSATTADSPSVSADAPGPTAAEAPDEIRLKNGGMYRGSLSEVVPGGHVSIVPLGRSEPVRIEWNDLAAVLRNGQALPIEATMNAPLTDVPPARSGASLSTPTGPQLQIKVDGEGDVELRRIVARISGENIEGTASQRVCKAPCNQEIPGADDGEFFIVGNRVQSKPFELADRGPSIHATVRPGHRGLRTGGVLLAALGGAATVGGVPLLAVAHGDDRFRTAGGVMLGVGIAALFVGIAMAVGGRTLVKFDE